MSSHEHGLRAVVSSVSDGERIDWQSATESVEHSDRGLIEPLRIVSFLSRIHHEGFASDALAAPPRLAPGRYGHLEIFERIGGGMRGEVYRARDTRLERDVALKLLPDAARQGRDDLPRRASPWLREAQRLASVRHSNVVAIHAVESVGGFPAIVMELIRGQTLAEIARDHGRFGAREVASLGLDLCRALAAVHGAGLLHQDIKMQNVMREEGGRIVLMDFGPGAATPVSMAPEILRGDAPTVRSDLYALGVLLFRLAAGFYPVIATSLDELRKQHDEAESFRLRDARPDLSGPLVQVIEKALSRAPDDRFATAGEMEAALASTLASGADEVATPSASVSMPHSTAPQPRPSFRARWPWIAATAAIGLIVAAVALPRLFQKSDETTDRVTPIGTETSPASKAAIGVPSFTVRAGLFRGDRQRDRLESGSRLALGDSLSLLFEASDSVYVYVIDRDDKGETFLLFPASGLSPQNPLAPNVSHVLPGQRDGRPFYWQVSSAAGGEHVLIVASRRPLPGLETEMLALERPVEKTAAEPASLANASVGATISEEGLEELRGLGVLVSGSKRDADGARGHSRAARGAQDPTARLFELADPLTNDQDRANGVWLRRIDLENPGPSPLR